MCFAGGDSVRDAPQDGIPAEDFVKNEHFGAPLASYGNRFLSGCQGDLRGIFLNRARF
ncbi:hypothetical protein Poly21_20760 [Allorhodopirellula heiligendammensis]|uniref:Uncharacterized protein n=1 Tax=Allorhodopirellula heiligendammensis TaxID=2714739 RepID=A0A5C6C7A1_9BACT|nr:hypothetical protein Poly21_20760 [Allorhodopirellula heiligendammensis]